MMGPRSMSVTVPERVSKVLKRQAVRYGVSRSAYLSVVLDAWSWFSKEEVDSLINIATERRNGFEGIHRSKRIAQMQLEGMDDG